MHIDQIRFYKKSFEKVNQFPEKADQIVPFGVF